MEDCGTGDWRAAMPCLCSAQAQRGHTAQLLVVNNSEEAGSLAAIPSQPPLWHENFFVRKQRSL